MATHCCQNIRRPKHGLLVRLAKAESDVINAQFAQVSHYLLW